MIQKKQFAIDTRYGLEVLHQCGKMVKTKSQKVLGLIPTFISIIPGKDGFP